MSIRHLLGRAEVAGQADSGWQAFTYTNSWAAYTTGGELTAGYRKIGSSVIFRGSVNGGASGNSIATLPSGYRPAGRLVPTTADYGGTAAPVVWFIEGGGTMTPNFSSGSTPVSLTGISFTVD